MIERRRLGGGKEWFAYKLAGSWGDRGTTRAAAREEAARLTKTHAYGPYRYRAIGYHGRRP